MNKQYLGWIIAGILSIMIIGFISFNYVSNKYYSSGIVDGQASIINEINTRGTIPVINNQTVSWIAIQSLCEGGE